MVKRFRLVCTAAALVPLTLLAAACSSSSSTPAASKSSTAAAAAANASGTSITETGSTILFPLFGAWQTAYSTANPKVTITSGATFQFGSYLNAQDPSLWPAADIGTTVTWPSVPGAVAETGNGGMVTGCAGIKDCIAYIGNSYEAKTTAAGIGQASVANKAGKYTTATPAAISAALASFPAVPAAGAEQLINTSAPTGYAIINYEYAIVKKTQPSAAEASAIKAFLSWILTTGDTSKYLSATFGTAVPGASLSVSKKLVSSLSG